MTQCFTVVNFTTALFRLSNNAIWLQCHSWWVGVEVLPSALFRCPFRNSVDGTVGQKPSWSVAGGLTMEVVMDSITSSC